MGLKVGKWFWQKSREFFFHQNVASIFLAQIDRLNEIHVLRTIADQEKSGFDQKTGPILSYQIDID
jgi:hypothetical protein